MSEQLVDPYMDEITERTQPPRLIRYLHTLPFLMLAGLMTVTVAWGVYRGGLRQPQSGPAPDFTLPLLGEEGYFTLSDHRGQVVVINFWASWCVPCRDEAPMLQRTFEAYQDQGVLFVGIDVQDPEDDALAFVAEFGITYPSVVDMRGEMEVAYRIQGVPETFVIGKDGNIVKFFFAQPPEADLRAAIEEALAG